jgi:hypothetical protein
MSEQTPLHRHEQHEFRGLDSPDFALWFGPALARTLDADEQRRAWNQVQALLRGYFPKIHMQASPGYTGLACIESTLPWGEGERPLDYPAPPDEIQQLLQLGQSRQACYAVEREASELVAYDRRVAYLALLRHLPTCLHGVQDDSGSEFAGHRPGWYEVEVRVPRDWTHIGLVPHTPTDGEWSYPCQPGEVFPCWTSHREVFQLLMHGWDVTIRRRVLFDEDRGPGSDPLKTFATKMRMLLERIEKDEQPAVRYALRALVIQAVGIMQRRWVIVGRYARLEDLPADREGCRTRHQADGTIVLERRLAPESHAGRWYRPEWAQSIYSGSRVATTRSALSVARTELAALDSDAVYLFHDPAWLDDGRVGTLRPAGRWTRPTPRPAPQRLEDYRAVKLGRAAW